MAKRTSTLYRIADGKLDGQLAERLRALRADDRSWRWIAEKLEPELGFRPTGETLRQWAMAAAAEAQAQAGPEAVAS